jgi:hypothetical protein
VLGEKIRAEDRLVDGGLNERYVHEAAAAETDGFVDFSPGSDAGPIRAGESRSVV